MHDLILAACPSLRFATAVTFLDGELPLEKALGPGERWITVHPPGHDKGVPILIQENPDGTATVIGGAGGKMNHLKLRGVKPQATYRQELSDKAAARREARKEQAKLDKESGVHEQKQALRKEVKEKIAQARKDFLSAVAEAAGWTEQEMAFDEAAHAGLSEAALAKAKAKHEADLFARARKTADVNRRMLVADQDKRAEAGLGELPLQSKEAEELSAADLMPMPETAPGLGFSADYKARAEAQGLTQEGLDAAVSATTTPKTPEQEQAAAEKKITADAIAQELADFAAQNPDTSLPSPKVLEDAKQSAAMVKAYKKLRMLEQAAREQSAAIDAAAIPESKAAVLEVTDADVDAAAAEEMENDLATAGTRAFLREAGKLGGEAGLGGNIGTGAFNALNAVAITVGGKALIDRSVVDVLGVEGAAHVLARRLHADLPPDDLENSRLAMADYHRDHYTKRQTETLALAQEYHDAAAAIELPEASNGFELAEAQAMNARRRDAINDAKRAVGQAMGEMRANAAVALALGSSPTETMEVSLGKQSAESAVVQLHAIGLKEGDYELAPAGDNLVVTIKAAGLDRLSQPIDKEDAAIIKRNIDIAAGKYDEDNWLPLGFSVRPDIAMKLQPGVAERLAKPFAPGPDLAASLRSYIGGRVADGDSLTDILADVQSAGFFAKAGDNAAYRKALDAVIPLKGEDGKMRPIESLQPEFEKYADEFVSDNYGADTSPLHRQSFEVSHDSVDALHRALAKTPEGVAAYKPVGELTPQERNGLRNWWYSNIAKESPEAGDLRHQLEQHLDAEPEKEFTDMFGETGTNPEWSAWNSKRQDLATKVGAASITWKKYVEAMGSPTAAITAVQDCVRSKVTGDFSKVYNTLRPDAPMKVGKTTIRGALDHLDAVDPAAREARLAKHKALIDSLRERIDGKYASGSVSDKLAAAKEEQAAYEQAQMGFFSVEDVPEPDETRSAMGADERYTMGHAADLKIASMMSVVGQNFQPGKPSSIWQPSMNGKFVAQQRAVKHIIANKRTVLGYGAGSGKTAIMLGAFSHLRETGQAKRAIYMVPSIVQGQFGGEALRFLEPGKYKWNASPGQSRAERIAAYKDPDTHFVVMTHQSFRDDMIHLGAQHAGISEDEMSTKLSTMTADDRKAWAKATMDHHGISFDASFVDEAHDTLNRAGKENSSLANVLDSVTDNTPYYVYASGDPAKNDACIHPDTIIHDPVRKISAPVKDWATSGVAPFVLSLDQSDGSIHVVMASVPFIKRKDRPMFRVVLASGDAVTVAADHRFLTQDGWRHLSSLEVGQPVGVAPDSLQESHWHYGSGFPREISEGHQKFWRDDLQSLAHAEALNHLSFSGFQQKKCVPSSTGASSPCAHRSAADRSCLSGAPIEPSSAAEFFDIRGDAPSCALRCWSEASDSLVRCSICSRPCDEQPRPAQAGAQAPLTSQVDALESSLYGCCSDDLERQPKRTRLDSLFYRHPSEGDLDQCESHSAIHAFSDTQSRFGCSNCEQPQETRRGCQPCLEESDLPCTIAQSDGGPNLVSDEFQRFASSNPFACGILFSKIVAILPEPNADIYDLSVPPFKNYLAHGIWHHNSEVHDLMAKMDRQRYGDRAEFMRKYGPDTLSARESLKREMARHVISNTIDSGAKRQRHHVKMELSGAQKQEIGEIDKAAARCNMARMQGTVDVEAAKKLSPEMFADVPEDQHAKVAEGVQKSAAIVRESAMKRIIDSHPSSPKFDEVVKQVSSRKGKQGVVFARRRDCIETLEKRLTDAGHRVVTITGSDSAADKDAKRLMFNPESGEAKADILLASDAAAVGMNLQSGQYLMQLDIPDTAKVHGQRNARIDRIGQKQDIDLIDLEINHPSEARARTRLQKKYMLREFLLDPMDGLDDTGLSSYLRKRAIEAHQKKMEV